MPSYLITGTSRGLGFEFVRQLSADPNNIVVGLVRDKATTDAKVKELNRSNIHIVQADLEDYASLKKTVPTVATLINGSLDYLIANAAFLSSYSAFETFGSLADQPENLEEDLLKCFRVNTIGTIHLFNLFMPFVLKSEIKKVIALTTGLSDEVMTAKYDLAISGAYSVSKAALNLAVAKFSAEYAREGVLFLGISPGYVETGQIPLEKLSEAQRKRWQDQIVSFGRYAPQFQGALTPEESVQKMLKVFDFVSVEGGYGGSYLSHHGNKQWI